jgi:hypothetical protein
VIHLYNCFFLFFLLITFKSCIYLKGYNTVDKIESLLPHTSFIQILYLIFVRVSLCEKSEEKTSFICECVT